MTFINHNDDLISKEIIFLFDFKHTHVPDLIHEDVFWIFFQTFILFSFYILFKITDENVQSILRIIIKMRLGQRDFT